METDRLILRKWRISDAESLYEYASDPDVGPIAGWQPHKSIDESREVIKNVFCGAECYAICEKGADRAIGAVELKLNGHTDMTGRDDECELGYWLGKPFWGRGYMPEAAGRLIRRGFTELGMKKIWCGYYDGNMKSKRVQEKLGFRYHHTCDSVPVPLMNEVRIGYTNLLTKEDWKKAQRMGRTVIYVHGKGGNAGEAEHYRPFFVGCDVIGFDYGAKTPWEAKEEFPRFFDEQRKKCASLTLIANSIGAFFSMSALSGAQVDEAFFISPIVDMERLIENMMGWAGVTEAELREKGEITTAFGEVLSWEYLCYVRSHPLNLSVPTRILYGENDNLTSYETVSAFAEKIGAPLTVMRGGEHWFHTEEQMAFLDEWIRKAEEERVK